MKKQFLLGLMAMLLPLTSWAAGQFTVTFKDKVTYAGDATKDAVEIVVKAGTTLLHEGPDYILSEPIRDAKKYTVTITGTPSNPLYKDYTPKPISFVVEKKEVPAEAVTLNNVEVPYTGEEPVLEDFLSDLVTVKKEYLCANTDAEEANFLAGLKVSPFGNETLSAEVGSYSVDVEDKGDVEGNISNYTYVRKADGYHASLTITAKELTLIFGEHLYKGEEYKVTDLTDKDYTLYETYVKDGKNNKVFAAAEELGTITFSKKNASDKLLNVNSYDLNVTFDNKNYVVKTNNVVPFTISHAPLKVTVADVTKLNGFYGYKNPVDLTGVFNVTGWVGADATAAKKPITLTLKRNEGTKKNVDGIEIENVGDYDVILYADGEAQKITKDAKGKYNTVTVGNYEIDYDPQVYHLLKKAFALTEDFTFEQNEDAELTYQGQDFDAENKNLLKVIYHPRNNSEVNMVLTEGVDYVLELNPVVGSKVRNAGDKFKVTVKAVAEDECNFRDTDKEGIVPDVEFRINKAELTITPKEDAMLKAVYREEAAFDLTDQFDFVGLQGEDQGEEENTPAAGVVVMKTTLSDKETKVGEWMIHIIDGILGFVKPAEYNTEDATKGMRNYRVNYDINKVKFTVLDPDFKLFGGEYTTDENGNPIKDVDTNTTKITTYAGVTTDVTIEHLTNMNDAGYRADRWYTLTLPFDVTVREISQAFGYAYVNVPQETNNNPNEMVYRMTMGTIPAHTLMAFKVDAAVSDDENEARHNPTLEFKDKKIVAIPEFEDWTTDNQGNMAIGTYEPLTNINKAGQWYLLPSNGKFTSAVGNTRTIMPFNGYFQFAGTPANARLILEEPDGSTTAIDAITGETISNAAEGWYSVDGVKLNAQPTQKGVYINNGKKVVIK